jgi:hypothetical protein
MLMCCEGFEESLLGIVEFFIEYAGKFGNWYVNAFTDKHTHTQIL